MFKMDTVFFEPMSQITIIGLTVLAGWAGLWLHEGTHYFFGEIGGGEPFVSRWAPYRLFPREIDFESPRAMSDRLVQLAGGFVILYPILAMFFWMIVAETRIIWFYPLFILFTTASLVSWFDLLALVEPGKWKQYTAGNPIQRDD